MITSLEADAALDRPKWPHVLHQVLKVAEQQRSFIWKFCYVSAVSCRKPFLAACGWGAKVGVKLWWEHGPEASVLPNHLSEDPAQSLSLSGLCLSLPIPSPARLSW